AGAKAAPPRAEVQSLWELAPDDATMGLVANDRGLTDLLELVADITTGAARDEIEKLAQRPSGEPLLSSSAWAAAGLDPALGGAMFTWPEKSRGALLVLPVSDRGLFRAAFRLRARNDKGRDIDASDSGYVCTILCARYLCARSLDTLDAAAAP